MVFVAVRLAEHVDLYLAEIAREGHLRRQRQIDVTKQDQFIIEKGFVDLGEHCRRHRLGQRNAGNFAANNRMQRFDRKRPIADGMC